MKTLTDKDFREIILKQFDIIWVEITFEELQKDQDWLKKYEYTEELNEEWLKWLRKKIKWYTLSWRLEKEVQWFNLDYWLKIKVNEKQTPTNKWN